MMEDKQRLYIALVVIGALLVGLALGGVFGAIYQDRADDQAKALGEITIANPNLHLVDALGEITIANPNLHLVDDGLSVSVTDDRQAISRIDDLQRQVAELEQVLDRIDSRTRGGSGAGGGLGLLESMCLGVTTAFTEADWVRTKDDPDTALELLYRTGEIPEVVMREWVFLQWAVDSASDSDVVEALDYLCWGDNPVFIGLQ